MKFSIVIGNPPYHGKLDLVFFDLAKLVSKQYISFIHPAKWKSQINVKEAKTIQEVLLNQKHLQEIHCIESKTKNKTEIWENIQTGSINYWLVDLKNTFEYVDTYITMSSRNRTDKPIHTKRKGTEEYFPYFCMNPIVLSIVKKVIENDKYKSIKYRFEQAGEIYVANTLYSAYTERDRIEDSKPRFFKKEELKQLNNYLQTPFWRALTRQFMSGFHSCNISFFNYLPDFDFMNDNITEEFIENYFDLDDNQRKYLRNYSTNITDAP